MALQIVFQLLIYQSIKLQMVPNIMPKVYNRLQSSFGSFSWPWSGRSLPKENQWEYWDAGLRPNDIGHIGTPYAPSLPPNIWSTQSQTGWYFVTWLVGWPIAAGKLAGWLTTYQTKCQPDPPPGWDILWPCVSLLWSHRPVVRCTPIETSHCKWKPPWPPWDSFVICNPTPTPPMPPFITSMPPPQYRYLVVKSGTTAGQIDIWSAFASGWPVYARVILVLAAIVVPASWEDIKVVAIKKLICYCLQFSIDHF